jgi:putative PIN family toxin of toxin-antitoxin system
MRLVFDTNVVLSGAGWRGEAHACLVKLARREVSAYATATMLEELNDVATRLLRAGEFPHDPRPVLTWYAATVRLVEPAPLGKPRSRDLKDDVFLAAALAARAKVVVAYDKDLLALEKPFGIEIVRPSELLRRLRP